MERRQLVFAAVSVGILLVAGTVAYVVWAQQSGDGLRPDRDAVLYTLGNAKTVVSRVVGHQGASFNGPADTPLSDVEINFPQGSLPEDTSIELAYTESDDLPPDTRRVSPQVHLQAPGVAEFDGRATMRIPFTDAVDPSRVVALSYDPVAGTWDAAAPLGFNREDGTATVETVAGTVVGLVEFTGNDLSSSVPFDPGQSWGVADSGSYLVPGGDTIGMASFAKWAQQRGVEVDQDDAQNLLAGRVRLSQQGTWTDLTDRAVLGGSPTSGVQLAALLRATDRPQLLLAGNDKMAEHALLATGFDGTHFTVYDPDFPGQMQRVPFETFDGWGTYRDWSNFGYYGLDGLSSEATLSAIQESAERGTLGDGLRLTSPLPGADVDSVMTVAGTADRPGTVVVFVGSDRFSTQTDGSGGFTLDVPVNQIGRVPVNVFVGEGDPLRDAGAATTGLAVERASGARFLVTLTWDTAGTDLDLYVTEPDGETVYYLDSIADTGGTLDVDDTSGFGPEHYTLDPSKGDIVEGGDYRVRVHYYEGSIPTNCRVSVIIYDDDHPSVTERSCTLQQGNSANDSPTDTGPDWFAVGTFRLAEPEVLQEEEHHQGCASVPAPPAPAPATQAFGGTGAITHGFTTTQRLVLFDFAHSSIENHFVVRVTGGPHAIDYLLVDSWGDYHGSRYVSLQPGDYNLVVEHGAAWTIDVEQPRPTTGPEPPGASSGDGDLAVEPVWMPCGRYLFETDYNLNGGLTATLYDAGGAAVATVAQLPYSESQSGSTQTIVNIPRTGFHGLDVVAAGSWTVTITPYEGA